MFVSPQFVSTPAFSGLSLKSALVKEHDRGKARVYKEETTQFTHLTVTGALSVRRKINFSFQYFHYIE